MIVDMGVYGAVARGTCGLVICSGGCGMVDVGGWRHNGFGRLRHGGSGWHAWCCQGRCKYHLLIWS